MADGELSIIIISLFYLLPSLWRNPIREQATKVDGEVVENEVETKDRSVRIEGYKWRSLDVKLRECLFAL